MLDNFQVTDLSLIQAPLILLGIKTAQMKHFRSTAEFSFFEQTDFSRALLILRAMVNYANHDGVALHIVVSNTKEMLAVNDLVESMKLCKHQLRLNG